MRKQFEEYFKSHNAHDIEKTLSFLSDDFVLHFTEYDIKIDKSGLIDVLGWDKGINGKVTHEKLTAKADSITGLFTERNDFLKLVGIEELKATISYRFDKTGKIVKQTYTPLPDQPSFQDKMQASIEWAKTNRQQELNEIYPKNQMQFNEEMGKRWVILLKEWKKQTEQDNSDLTHENSPLAARVDNYLKSASSLGFSGSIIVSEGSEIILQKGYGLANRENRTEYSTNTIQSCGSITKQFTAAAIVLLESKNSISVNDKLSKYFSSTPKEHENITIHQLLTHSSGIIGGIGPDEEPISKEAYLERLWLEPLEFEPGSDYRYSNAGYSLLGMIIEQVSKMNYEDFLREYLFIPSKMENTGYLVAGKDTTQLATGYNKGKYWGKVYKNGWLKDGPNWHLRANGGIHTTVEDMYKWFQVMLGNGVLEDDIIDKWTTGYVNENNADSKYAYGLVVYNDQKYGKIISHSGSNRIFAADLVWLPEKNILYYIHSNSSLFPAYEISNHILSAAFDPNFQSPPDIKIDDKIKPETIRKLEGTYEVDGGSVELTSDDIRIMAKLIGQPMLDLLLNHTSDKQEFFSNLNLKTNEALRWLKEGRTDALKDLMAEGENPLPATENLLKQIDQIGNLEYLHLIGTFENPENSRFSKVGAYTTFVHARFPNWNRYWNFVFDKDGNYLGTYSGPWPSFTMIPVESNKFIAVNQEFPHETAEVVFQENCLILNGTEVCVEE